MAQGVNGRYVFDPMYDAMTECWCCGLPEAECKFLSKPKRVVAVSKTVYARELVLREGVTVGDLFALIDIPFQLSKKAKVSIRYHDTGDVNMSLRVEWTGDNE